tara:strand:- start:222 stop:413 length:192 start_codon:yes stop_codon:yes gene_type:complete
MIESDSTFLLMATLEQLESELGKITPQIIKLEMSGQTAYTSSECAALWKEARRINNRIRMIKL